MGGNVTARTIVDDTDGQEHVRFYCVLSTENLLLNGPRQVATGQQMMLAVDASYRYVVEKDHGLFVVKCKYKIDASQASFFCVISSKSDPIQTNIDPSTMVFNLLC